MIIKEEMISIEGEIESIISKDDRLKRLVEDLPKMNYGKDYSKVDHASRKGFIKIGDIYALAAQNYPLCMQEMHRELVTKFHLRHYGRLQYGAFLKGAGVRVEDAVQFFKREFSKGNPKKVNEYTYYVEHLYGLKGKKTSYSPWSCNKMINQNTPNSGEVHGCPFAHYGENSLRTTLRKRFSDIDDIEQIMSALHNPSSGKPKAPGDACRKHFMLLHPGAKFVDNVGRHPNAYLDASLRFKEYKDRIEGNAELPKEPMDEEKPKVAYNNITDYTHGVENSPIRSLLDS